jgi:hypothetical protein
MSERIDESGDNDNGGKAIEQRHAEGEGGALDGETAAQRRIT